MRDLRAGPMPSFAQPIAWACGLMHAIVDAASIAVLTWGLRAPASPSDASPQYLSEEISWSWFLLYTVLAFGMQFPIGALVDRWKAYRLCLLGGLVLVALGIAAGPFSPFMANILAALGNAAFHVGAGALVMTHSPNRTAAAGVFVGPGAVGLAFGVWCVRAANLGPWIFLMPLAACAALALVPAFAEKRSTQSPPAAVALSRSVLVLCLATIFLTIAIRSANGHGVWAVHEGHKGVIWGLAFAACAGNILGGFVADRLGWVTTCVLVLVLSSPLVSVFVDNGIVAIVGMVLFQMTMPVTLTAVWWAMPGDAGLAFGLAAFAVLAGVLPVYVCPVEWITPRPLLLSLTLAAIAGILVGLPPIVRSCSNCETTSTGAD